MEQSLIAWNFANVVTLLFMIAFVWLACAGARKIFSKKSEKTQVAAS